MALAQFWNRNQMVVLHAIYEGRPDNGDLLQVGAIPLDSRLDVATTNTQGEPLYPFSTYIKPSNSKRGGVRFNDARACGLDYYDAAESFLLWEKTLKLDHNKKIWPVVWSATETLPWFMDWLTPVGYESLFYEHTLCLKSAMQMYSVKQYSRGDPITNSHYQLIKILSCNRVPLAKDEKENRIHSALIEADAIRKLMQKHSRCL